MKNLAFWLWNSLPENARIPLDILRRCHRWKKEGVLFIHVPKAAGVSVNQAIYGRPLGHFYAKDIKRICPKIFINTFSFSVVRNPVNRLYSAYSFSRQGGTSVMGMSNPDFYINNPDFTSFEKFVTNWLKKQDLSKIDGIFRPQYLYLFDDSKNLLVDKFYKLEGVERNFDEISEKIGKPFILDHHNKSDRKNIEISDELRATIYEIYKQDFELLDYSLSEDK
jgi:hypothetical protein